VGAHLLLILVVTAAYIIIPWQAASILKAGKMENGAGYGANQSSWLIYIYIKLYIYTG
jgi:hypothetical protein